LQLIKSKIYEIRGQRVMLDFDLAELYGVETRILKQAVRRNPERFPEDFMFEMSEMEALNLRSQIVISSWGGSRYRPFVFTEQGVAMLSSVLRSSLAIQVNIAIMRAFVAIRGLVISSGDTNVQLRQEVRELKEYIEDVFTDQNDINEDTRIQLELINQTLAELQVRSKKQEKVKRSRIGFIRPEGDV